MPAIPLFILQNWKWLLGAVVSVVLGVIVGIQKIEIAELNTAAAKTALKIETQKTEATNTLATETSKILARERQIAELTAQLEKTRADEKAKDLAAAASLADAQRLWKQAHPGCRPSSPPANGESPSAAGAADAAHERIEILPVGSHSFISRCAADHDELAGYARECNKFVLTLPKVCQP